ncbi:MAG: FKBP-type peptidyl-prolyl cis-trans isomerase [Pseudomonadota bacterium]
MRDVLRVIGSTWASGVGSAARHQMEMNLLLNYVATAFAALTLLVGCGPREPGEPEELPDTPPSEGEAAVNGEGERTDARALFARQAAENLAASTAYLAENAEREGVTTTESGLQYMIVEEGPEGGATPVSTDLVQVHYVGTLKDGLEFDSSRARGAAASFRLDRVIPGWTEGVQLMSEGDRFRLFVPPDLGYGEAGTPGGPIGPNEALIFDVELIKVQNPVRNLEAANEFLTANAEKEGVNTTDTGLQYEVLRTGDEGAASPSARSTVEVHYQGTLLNGTEFDSSYSRGQPIEFPLNRVIPGWTEGVQLMRVGDKFRFFVPPDLAYGASGKGPIGPNELLIFEVELLDVK